MRNQSSASCGQNAGVGMVHGTMQQMYELYPVQTALRRGTLYPELDKPMGCAPVPTGCAEAKPSQELAFAAWETRLYLNTHPCDNAAVQLFQQLCQQMRKPNYACSFAECAANGTWNWTEDPWPWEVCANDGRA